jgi:hypothetical protein
MRKAPLLVRPTCRMTKISCRSMGWATHVGLLIATTGAILLGGGGAAISGPCTMQIERFERQLVQAADNEANGPTAPQSVGAQLHYQPTPGSVQIAESNAAANVYNALQRARQADEDGDAAECANALAGAKHHWIIGFPPIRYTGA